MDPSRQSLCCFNRPVTGLSAGGDAVMTRRDFETLFDRMEEYRAEHPNASDDEAFEYICRWNTDRQTARIEALKEDRREQHIA